ncbi:MAG: MFS transporter [Microthrixaceae bacterium]
MTLTSTPTETTAPPDPLTTGVGTAAETGVAPAATAPRRGGRRWIDQWDPEDTGFWEATGARIARRNLVFSILSEHVGFSIWSMWSVLVLFLGPEYGFTPAQKFLLTTVPVAVGAAIRIPYTFAVARFGGRNFTIVSSATLLIPAVVTAAVLQPGVSFTTLLAVSALAGIGGGNFSSSMSNIDGFYPQRLKGWALGLNAGGGNIGVAGVQLVGLVVLATAGAAHPRFVIAAYVPLIVLSTLCAARWMDNLGTATNDKGAMRSVLRIPHSGVILALYVGTFGSFIGFGFAFGQVLTIQFPDHFATASDVARLAILGPLVGSLIRPVGGRMADRFGGAAVTLVVFLAMFAGAGVVLVASLQQSLPLFIVAFTLLFVLSGLGNGSVYKMIPSVFRSLSARAVEGGQAPAAAAAVATRRSRALIGLGGAVGAFGGVLVNLALRQSFLGAGDGNAAYIGFMGYYLAGAALTWFAYVRAGRMLDGV